MIEDNYTLEELSDMKEIAFPNVRSWEIISHLGLLQALDLSCASTLDFDCLTYPLSQINVAFSTQLTKLSLTMIAFTYNSRPNGQPQLLPRLRSLELENVFIQGLFQDYIICPELETLSFCYAPDELDPILVDRVPVELKDELSHKIGEVFDEEFFQGVPNLKSISVFGLHLDSSFLFDLQPCMQLETLVMEECSIQDLIPCLIEYLRKLPSLMNIRIDDSWPRRSNKSYQQFIKDCLKERPGICIYGNGQV
jgi:hypothetical protein